MTRLLIGLLVPLLAGSAIAGEKQSDDKKPPGPAEEFYALKKEFTAAQQAYFKAAREAKTDEERRKAFTEKYPKTEKYIARFIELAEQNSKEPFAAEALIWVVEQSGGGGSNKTVARALQVLQRDHLDSVKLGAVCQRLTFGIDKASEDFLRIVSEKSVHREVQGKALLALGQFLRNRPSLLEQMKNNPRVAKALDGSDDNGYFKRLTEQDPAVLAKEAEQILERAVKDYGDVKLQSYGSIGAKAKSELYDLRFLSVGKTAPDIEGQDQDGKKFKLSDYRGKVVLLDF